MRTRIRLGPFTFGKSGMRLSIWRGGTGFSLPLFNKRSSSFGKVKLGIFSFFFSSKSKKTFPKKSLPENITAIKKKYKQAYEPWTKEADEKLVRLFRQGKTVKELSVIFGRTQGAICARINKLLLN